MEIEIMKYWSNKFGIIDIDNFPYRIENVIYSYITRHEDEYYMVIYVQREYYKSITNTFQIPSNSHIIIEVKNANIEYQYHDEFLILNEMVIKTYSIFYTKAYLVFPTKSDLLKWKLKL